MQKETFLAKCTQSVQKCLNWHTQSESFGHIWNFQNVSFCLFWSIPPYIVTRGRISYKFHTNGKIYKRKRKEEGIAIFYSILFSPSVNSTQGAENSQTEQPLSLKPNRTRLIGELDLVNLQNSIKNFSKLTLARFGEGRIIVGTASSWVALAGRAYSSAARRNLFTSHRNEFRCGPALLGQLSCFPV